MGVRSWTITPKAAILTINRRLHRGPRSRRSRRYKVDVVEQKVAK